MTVTLQPAQFPDVEDGLGVLPYPWHVEPSGEIGRQDFWRGHPERVIGFVADPKRQEVDLWWREAAFMPDSTVGMYVITEDCHGQWSTHLGAISSVNVHD